MTKFELEELGIQLFDIDIDRRKSHSTLVNKLWKRIKKIKSKARREIMKYNDVYIVDGSRTPFLKARGTPGKFKALDLAIHAARPLLIRMVLGMMT